MNMICEICGKEHQHLRKANIEGSILNVCNDCVKFGREIKEDATIKHKSSGVIRGYSPRKDVLEAEEILVEDYSNLIKKARVKKGMTQEQLAKNILEKKNVISKLERGEMHPTKELIKKLSKELKIKITEKISEKETIIKTKGPSKSLTLGDLIEAKLKN